MAIVVHPKVLCLTPAQMQVHASKCQSCRSRGSLEERRYLDVIMKRRNGERVESLAVVIVIVIVFVLLFILSSFDNNFLLLRQALVASKAAADATARRKYHFSSGKAVSGAVVTAAGTAHQCFPEIEACQWKADRRNLESVGAAGVRIFPLLAIVPPLLRINCSHHHLANTANA